MAKGVYVGVGGVAKKVKSIFVGVNGAPRKVKQVYVGVGGAAKLVWQSIKTKFTPVRVINGNDANLRYQFPWTTSSEDYSLSWRYSNCLYNSIGDFYAVTMITDGDTYNHRIGTFSVDNNTGKVTRLIGSSSGSIDFPQIGYSNVVYSQHSQETSGWSLGNDHETIVYNVRFTDYYDYNIVYFYYATRTNNIYLGQYTITSYYRPKFSHFIQADDTLTTRYSLSTIAPKTNGTQADSSILVKTHLTGASATALGYNYKPVAVTSLIPNAKTMTYKGQKAILLTGNGSLITIIAGIDGFYKSNVTPSADFSTLTYGTPVLLGGYSNNTVTYFYANMNISRKNAVSVFKANDKLYLVGFSANGNDVRMGAPILMSDGVVALIRVTDESFICQTGNASTSTYTIYSCVINSDGSISTELKSGSGNYIEYINSFNYVNMSLAGDQISPTTVSSEDSVVLVKPNSTGSLDSGSNRSYIAASIVKYE